MFAGLRKWMIGKLDRLRVALGGTDMFEAAFENASIPMALIEPKSGKWLRINRAVELFLERPREEILAHTFQDYTASETKDGNLAVDLQLVKECLDGKRDSFELDKAYAMPDERVKHGHLAAVLVRFNGKPSVFISQITDVEAQYQLGRQLRESLTRERRSREALEREVAALRGRGESGLAREFERLLHDLGEKIDRT